MIDYRLRVYRRFPQKQMYQVVIYLKQTDSEEVYKNTFSIPGTRHEFNVIRLWEQPKEVLSPYVGLLPLAVLCRADDREATLRQVAREIDGIDDRRQQSNVAAATAILAGLVLDKGLIKKVLKKEIMKESVIYQDIWDEARIEGRAEGRAEGLEEGVQQVAVNLLQNGITPEDVVKFTGLSLEQVQSLSAQLD